MKINLSLKGEPIGVMEWVYTEKSQQLGELRSIITPEYPEIALGLRAMLTDPEARPEVVYCHGHRYDDLSPFLDGVVQVLDLAKKIVPGFDHDFSGDLTVYTPRGVIT